MGRGFEGGSTSRVARGFSGPGAGMGATKASPCPAPIYFTKRRPGPELALEDAVVGDLPSILPRKASPSFVFGSKPIGAGAPDLTVVYCGTQVGLLAELGHAGTKILAYLRVIRQVRLETLGERLRLRPSVLERCVDYLASERIISYNEGVITLGSQWRDVLHEVVTIEAKVSKWRQAVSQASRNLIFAHRSFVALPESQARIASQDPMLGKLGIGVVGITSGSAKLIRRSRRSRPRVWRYYYELAAAAGRCLKGPGDNQHSPDWETQKEVAQHQSACALAPSEQEAAVHLRDTGTNRAEA